MARVCTQALDLNAKRDLRSAAGIKNRKVASHEERIVVASETEPHCVRKVSVEPVIDSVAPGLSNACVTVASDRRVVASSTLLDVIGPL